MINLGSMKLILFTIIVLSIMVVGLDQASAEVTITPALGSGASGCETTSAGCYHPNVVSVAVGEKIIMQNTDTAAHTFTAGTPDGGPNGEFDTGLLMAGNSFEWTPTVAGKVPYFCMVHP